MQHNQTQQEQNQQPTAAVPSLSFLDPQEQPQQGNDKNDEQSKERERRAVKSWTEKILKARSKWEPDFKQMREDMKFARGIQWDGQKSLMDNRYVCNLTLRNISQGVATLYAKNPECEAQRRDRMDFQLWDGKAESIIAAQQAANLAIAQNQPPNPLALQLMQDYSEGQLWRALVERVGKTVSTTFQYMLDSLQPNFKIQMKQLVRRVKTCGVAYVQINYVDGFEGTMSTSETESTIIDRVKHIKHIAKKLEDNKIQATDPSVLDISTTAQSVAASVTTGDTQNLNQRITFDFLPSFSVIPDPGTRHLKGFVGTRWLAIERVKSLDKVNEFYETKITSSEAKSYDSNNAPQQDLSNINATTTSDNLKKRVCIWDVYDLETKSCFVICDGWKEFVQPPEAVMPDTNYFWPVVALTFNDIETEPDGSDCNSIFPPSDVSLMRSPQKEWNRTRNALRSHRVANTPCYITGSGWLTDEDKEKINDHEDSAIVELQGAQLGVDLTKLLPPFAHSPIQPTLYDTGALSQDIQLSAGTQEPDLGRPIPKVTATGASIAEQSKNTVSASNVDDLDDFLSELAQIGGEIILRYFSLDTVKRVAGRGAVLPQQNREDFINEIVLSVKAASSGRPNKVLDISNFKEIVPMLIQALANPTGPLIGLAEEGIRRLGDNLDVSKLITMGPPPINPQQQQQQQQPNQPPSQHETQQAQQQGGRQGAARSAQQGQ